MHKQQIGALLSEEAGAQQAISHLEVKLRQVNAMADEQVGEIARMQYISANLPQ